MSMMPGRLLAAFVCAAVSSCFISPKDYPVGDIATGGAANNAGGQGGSTEDQTEAGASGTSGATMGGAATGGTAGAPLTTAACDRSTWTATAFAFTATVGYGDGKPSEVLDGSDQTRWTSGVPQAPGQWLQVDLGTPAWLMGLQLRCVQFPDDQPIAVTLELDGAPVDATSTIVGPAIELTFAPVLAHSARIVLLTPSVTMVAPMSPSWWSMDELDGTCVMGAAANAGTGGGGGQIGGAGASAGAAASTGGAGAASCLSGWKNSTCDKCSTLSDQNDQMGCANVLTCCEQQHLDCKSACTTCGCGFQYDNTAAEVYACKCP